ncbi:MAG: lipid II flippase MurJ, partial [Patescibacteria group bacterium]|nr:lipid II flippase MurJ [Patescibacteria group bacterium]
MVRRVLQVMYRDIRGLHEAAYFLAAFAFGSQILALVRDRLLAHEFGAGAALDIYYAAFRIPDFLFAVFASALSVYVLIPFLADRMLENIEKARELVSTVFTWFLLGYGAIALVIFSYAHGVVALFFPGFGIADQELLALVMRILLLQSFFLCLSGFFGVVTQLHRKFILYALSPLLYNVGIICGIIFLYPILGLSGLAAGVVIGAVLHLSVQIPFVFRSGLFPRLLGRVDVGFLLVLLKSSLPRAFALMLQQFVLLALTAIATSMTTGSVAVLQFAYNLQSVPLAIIGVSYSVAAFPTLARLYSGGDRAAYLAHVYTALRHIIFWSIPTIALFVVIRAQLVRVILGSGAFDWNDTRLTAATLALFALSLVSQGVHLLIVRAFYAGGNTRTPLIVTTISSIGIVCAAAFLYILYGQLPFLAQILADLFRVADVVGTEMLILPLAFSSISIVHSVVLVYLFMRQYGKGAGGDVRRVLAQSLGAGVVVAAASYAALNILVGGFRVDTSLGVFMQGFIAGVVGIAAGGIFLWSAGSHELKEVGISMRRRFWQMRPIVPQEKE